MFFIREINPLSFSLLERIYRQSIHHKVRQRAHFLILASQQVKIEKLMEIFNISHRTIYNWLNRWETVIVVDKASIHTSGAIFDRLEEGSIPLFIRSEEINFMY
jgi:Fe2+ or Zn2+ uptake regulation protein